MEKKAEILRQAVFDLREQNRDLSEKEAKDLAKSAVSWVRKNKQAIPAS